MLEGSVRKAARRVRVTAQLIDANTGLHLWAQRYDRPLDDVFAIQDDITLRIALALQPELTDAELRKTELKRTTNLTAWDYHLRGMSLLVRARPAPTTRRREVISDELPNWTPRTGRRHGPGWGGVTCVTTTSSAPTICKVRWNSAFPSRSAGGETRPRDQPSRITYLSTAYVWREQLSQGLAELAANTTR